MGVLVRGAIDGVDGAIAKPKPLTIKHELLHECGRRAGYRGIKRTALLQLFMSAPSYANSSVFHCICAELNLVLHFLPAFNLEHSVFLHSHYLVLF